MLQIYIIKNFLNSENYSKNIDSHSHTANQLTLENYFINLLLIQKTDKKFSIGLDLSFAILKDLKKIEFDPIAPSHRETSDGLNIFFYCKNPNCQIYDDLFIINLRYGKFNILNEINSTKCIKCNGKNIVSKNVFKK